MIVETERTVNGTTDLVIWHGVCQAFSLAVAGIVIAGIMAFGLLGCSPKPLNPPSTPEEAWRQDLNYLANELPRLHKDLFFQLPEEDFRQEVSRLDQTIPSLTRVETILGIARLVAMVGDSHTRLEMPQKAMNFHLYPLDMYWFKDGLYVMRTTPEYRRALGAQLVKIGSSDVESVAIRAKELIAHENQAMLKLNTPRYLILAEVLQAQGVLPTAEKGQFTFQDAEGRPFEMEVTPLLGSEVGELVSADEAATKPMYRQKPEVAYWFQYLEDSRTLYVQYNQCREIEGQSFKDFSKQVLSFVDAHTVDRFVLDLRHNGGGNSTIAEPLIAGIKQRPGINRKGHLFVIVGRSTFSSAILNALQLKNETEAIFVGEPTAGKPNHYGEVKSLTLPNSGLKVSYSTKYFQYAKEDTPSFEPDHLVELEAADVLAGRDPALEIILQYPR